MNKKVLFIAYHFPPIGGSGVQRSLKHVKYLPLYNCEPIVVTVKNGHNFAYDFSMLDEIPKGTKVYRSNSGEKLWLRNIIENINELIFKIKNRLSISKDCNDISECDKNDIELVEVPKESIKDKVFKYLEYNYYVPDTKIRWYKNAIKDIKNRVLKENDIDVIYSTSSPYTDHLIALEIKKITKKPWVADFRDPWVGNKIMFDRYNDKRKQKEMILEREVIKHADIVIQVTAEIVKQYKERYPEYQEKFRLITNGFDTVDIDGIKEEKNEKFTIRYTGTLSEGFPINTLVEALEKVCAEESLFKENFILEFTGFISSDNKAMLLNSGIKSQVKFNEYVTHSKAVELMKNSELNIIILPDEDNSKGIYTGKIFDCMLSEKPILGIMPIDGIAAKTINENDIGRAYNHSEVIQVKDYILSIYNSYKNGESIKTNAISKCAHFDRKNLSKQLSVYIDEIFNN